MSNFEAEILRTMALSVGNKEHVIGRHMDVVTDSNGVLWFYDHDTKLLDVFGDDWKDGGEFFDTWEDALTWLMESGYIYAAEGEPCDADFL